MKCRIQKAGLCLSFFFLLVLMMPFVVVAEMDTVDIMIQETSSISFDRGDAKATKEDGYIELTAGASDTFFFYPVNQNVNLNHAPYLYFNVEASGGWDIQFLSSAAYDDIMPGFSSDFGPDFGVKEGHYGELLPSGSYLPDDVPIYAKGAYTWNENLPENGVVTIKQVLIRVEARKTLRLYELYFGQEPEEEPRGRRSSRGGRRSSGWIGQGFGAGCRQDGGGGCSGSGIRHSNGGAMDNHCR